MSEQLADGWAPIYEAWAATHGELLERVEARRRSGVAVYPPDPLRALRLTALDRCHVVILGQDPYHGPGQAEGLAFSVPHGLKPPPSLRNILSELERDCGIRAAGQVSLLAWAQRGALLLNTVLTVEDGLPASHARWGWEALTDSLIHAAARHPAPKAFLLWGAHAQAKRELIEGQGHLVLTANHPSPLSARRPPQPFLGCGHFRTAQAWLSARGVNWSWDLALPTTRGAVL